MTHVHPHWHTTEDVKAAKPDVRPSVAPQQTVMVSRRPAAMVGVLVVVAIGYSLFQGFGGLLGQVTSDAVTVTITKDGFTPQEIDVAPGQSVVWKNTDSIPHILFSDTLKISNDQPFQSSPIFKNGELKVVIPALIELGDYDYASRTKTDFKGIIHVIAAASSSSSGTLISSESSASSVAAQFSSSEVASSSSVAPQAASSESQALLPMNNGGIPENPYTVGSVVQSPLGGQVTQNRSSVRSSAKSSIKTTTPPIKNVKPVSQPASGPTVWVVVIAAAIVFAWTIRNAFAVRKA